MVPPLALEACSCGAAFTPDAAFCLRCGARRGRPGPQAVAMQPAVQPFDAAHAYPCAGPAHPIGYATAPTPFEQVAPASAAPPWFQQPGGFAPGAQGQFPWPGAQAQYPQAQYPQAQYPYGPPQYPYGPAYMPADHPAMQAVSPRFQNVSPRMLEQASTGAADGSADIAGGEMNARGSMVGNGAAQVSGASDPKQESLLHCRPCKLNCKRRCKKPSCSCCKRLPSCKRAAGVLHRLVYSACRPCVNAPVIQSGRWRQWMLVVIGLGSISCLLFALLDDPPHLMGAGLAAFLGWLVCYAYMLQRECWRLAKQLESDLSRQLGGNGGKAGEVPALEAVPPLGGVDLDVTGLARSLGSPFGNALGAVAPGRGKSGQTMQAVMTSALVNEYLRCSSTLEKYQKRHGILPNAPECNPGFAQALLTGLHGPPAARSARTSPRSSRVNSDAGLNSPMATGSRGFKGTPNFADRLAGLQAELGPGGNSPVPVRNSPFAESQRAGTTASSDSSSQATSTAPPPPPSSTDLVPCDTITNASGARSSCEASPESVRGPAARSEARSSPAARNDDLESSINDPPWLRAIRSVEPREAPKKEENLDSSINDPPWLRQIRRD